MSITIKDIEDMGYVDDRDDPWFESAIDSMHDNGLNGNSPPDQIRAFVAFFNDFRDQIEENTELLLNLDDVFEDDSFEFIIQIAIDSNDGEIE